MNTIKCTACGREAGFPSLVEIPYVCSSCKPTPGPRPDNNAGGIKSAEEWAKEWPGESSQGCVTIKEYCQRIIDDSFAAGVREGMTKAAKIAQDNQINSSQRGRAVELAILAARDEMRGGE